MRRPWHWLGIAAALWRHTGDAATATQPLTHAAPAYPATVLWVGPNERFTGIQQALDSLNAPALASTPPASSSPFSSAPARTEPAGLTAAPSLHTKAPNDWVLIRVQPGIYREKLWLTRDRVVIAGSGMGQTILQYPELRQHFLARQQQGSPESTTATLPRGTSLERDWGAAVVNIKASDIALLDLTVHNSYALEHPTDPARFEHQFAVRGFATATRFLTDQAEFLTFGADTVAMWNKPDGQYYHSHSRFVGRVDLFCPRGSAVVEYSEFVNHSPTATLWHDGEGDPNQLLVVRHSKFLGVTGFELGRRHYDGQFVLIGNQFSANMAPRPIYRRTYPDQPWRDQANQYGDRYRFADNRWLGTPPATPTRPEHVFWQDNLNAQQAAQYHPDLLFAQWRPTVQLAQFRRWLATADAASHTHPSPNPRLLNASYANSSRQGINHHATLDAPRL